MPGNGNDTGIGLTGNDTINNITNVTSNATSSNMSKNVEKSILKENAAIMVPDLYDFYNDVIYHISSNH